MQSAEYASSLLRMCTRTCAIYICPYKRSNESFQHIKPNSSLLLNKYASTYSTWPFLTWLARFKYLQSDCAIQYSQIH